MSQDKPNSMRDAYLAKVAASELTLDAGQRRTAELLGELLSRILGEPVKKRFWQRKAARADGLYLWGSVGRGKSMLMDMFVTQIKALRPTRRVHFHAFMLDVHKRLHQLRQGYGGDDLLPRLIAEIADECRVLCLDEMQVSDVTDAMILSRLFAGLMDAGITVVFTSNRHPRDLYQGGLQREQFLKFVELLENRIAIHHIESPTDYRLQQLAAMQRTYMYPRDGEADDFLVDAWKRLTHGAPSEPLKLEVQGRVLRLDKHAQGVAWLTFAELCVRPLGANDYLTLAKVCHTLILQGIPKLTPEERNEAKRFVTLIDALYDHRVKLVATAATPPDDIYPSGDGTFEFARTASRLHEMQSAAYLALPHLPA